MRRTDIIQNTEIDKSRCRLLRQFYSFSLVCLLAMFASTLVATNACARPQFVSQFKSVYTTLKAGGTIETAACSLCHAPSGPPKFNKYGATVKQALEAAGGDSLNASILHSVEMQDSDGDGFSNLEEINADTLPGDESNHPAGKPKSFAAKEGGTSSGPNPFDIKTILFAKNAQHPVIIHLPIGLFIASLLFDVVGRIKKNEGLNIAAFYNLCLAAFTGIFAIVTGIIAWQLKLAGEPLVGNLRLHLILGIATCVLMFILLAVRKKGGSKPTDAVTTAYLLLAVVTAGLISLTGHLGGIISGVVS